MIFRLANKTDIEAIYKIYLSVKGEKFCSWNFEYPTKEEVKNDISHKDLFVLEIQNIIIGSISIVPENELDDLTCWWKKEKVAEIARVVISKSNQQKGYGKYLLSYILEELSNRGYKTVHLSVAKKNIPAQRLYENFGFMTVGEKDMYGGSYYLMEKSL